MCKLTPRQRDVLRIVVDAGYEGTVLNKNDTEVAWRVRHSGCGLIGYRFEHVGNRDRLVWVATERGVKGADA